MKKTMYATIAVIAAESCFATVWPTVNTVAEFTNAVAKAEDGDRIVLAAGKTFDFSTLSAYNDGTSWGTMSAPSGDGSGKSCVWFGKRLEIFGEDTSRYDEKTVEQETIVKGGNDGRIFYGYAGPGRQSSFAHLTFLGGTAESGKNGGAVYFLLKTDTGKATNCVFRGCSANTGGATYCVSAYGCLFADNTSDDRGGAALGDGNEFVGCVFRGNTACGIGGGALRENHLAKDIVGCVFSNNVATTGHSGALYINEMASGSSAKIVGCRFENNSANTQGGAMSGLGDIENCVFIGNTAGANGGAVAFSGGYSLTGSCFVGNTASGAGGAVYAPRIAAVSNCAFTNNYATGACGGVFLANVTGIFTGCFFHSNTGVVTTAGGQLCKAMEVVGCRFSGNGDPAIRCRISVTPKKGWALVETQFPRCALSECLGSSPKDDAVVIGSGHGGLVRYPMNPRREYWKDRQFASSPGGLAAQFGCFYDDAGGLYTAAEDAAGNEKALLMDRWWRGKNADGTVREGDFIFRWSREEYSETTDEQPYDIVLRGFSGVDGEEATWHDAADIYKEWAKGQFWCRKTLLEKKGFLPEWTRDAPVMMEFNREWLGDPGLVKRWLDGYWKKNFPDAPLVIIAIGWEQHGDWIANEYFPPYPSEKGFAEIVKMVQEAGGHLWLWPGGHHWNVQVGKRKDGSFELDFSKDFWKRAAPHAVCGLDGKPVIEDLVWLRGGNSASMCSADPWTVDWWNHDVACECVRRGAELVQADQDVGARIPPVCWSRKHGHKPGPGAWRMASQRHEFETMIGEIRKIDKWAMFSFEEMHEYFNDLYTFADYRNCRWDHPEWASVWNYLYHEYVPPFQSGREMYGKWMWLAHAAADGQMPRLPVFSKFYGEKATDAEREVLSFCERWVRLYRGEGRKWLAHGRELHPPKVECELVAYRDAFRGNIVENDKPAVFGTAWEATDGTQALMFSNATEREQNIVYRWAGEWQRLSLMPHAIRLVPLSK